MLAHIKIKASAAFDKIGKTNGTAPAPSLDNRYTIAHELFVSYALESMAKKRKELAKEAAEAAGILGDNYVEGNSKVVYETDEMQIVAKTANAAQRIDPVALKNELVKKLGLTETLNLLNKVTKSNKPATSFEFVDKGE